MPNARTSDQPILNAFETFEERLRRLHSATKAAERANVSSESLSNDILDWIEYLAVPSQVPFVLEAQSDGVVLSVGPQDDTGPAWVLVNVYFDDAGNWQNTILKNENIGRTLSFVPQPGWGLVPSMAAALLGLQLFGNEFSRRPSWSAWSLDGKTLDTDMRHRLEERRIEAIHRLRNLIIAHEVRNRALEGVAKMHSDDFETALRSEVIMTALSSDWHPTP